ncbi:hypothetical protein M9H77_02969 [Catharanthus roseus]|uniref:Uncharacterized protein n=1 Tax=Catharanthus roseus TaxID=4058 RepID=A0ACC0C9Z0_CATRO|nr:hypothetical protein M9H77_02969 [Catharanthus roseus]
MKCSPKVKTMKGNENERKWSRWQQGSQPTTRGSKQRPTMDGRPPPTVGVRIFDLQLGDLKDELRRLPFVCNLIVARLDYSQGCLELKKEEQSRQPIGG